MDIIESKRPYYLLKMYIDSNDNELLNLYKESIDKHNSIIEQYFKGDGIDNCICTDDSIDKVCFDAGIDLFCPHEIVASQQETHKIDHKVKTGMDFIYNDINNNNDILHSNFRVVHPVGYYLYPRSSTGTKTPLRLANSVGIIDSGYRGNIIAVFDNWKHDDYIVQQYQRIVQLCPPNLSYPIYVRIVETEEDLGLTTRGENGFGSSGN